MKFSLFGILRNVFQFLSFTKTISKNVEKPLPSLPGRCLILGQVSNVNFSILNKKNVKGGSDLWIWIARMMKSVYLVYLDGCVPFHKVC